MIILNIKTSMGYLVEEVTYPCGRKLGSLDNIKDWFSLFGIHGKG